MYDKDNMVVTCDCDVQHSDYQPILLGEQESVESVAAFLYDEGWYIASDGSAYCPACAAREGLRSPYGPDTITSETRGYFVRLYSKHMTPS